MPLALGNSVQVGDRRIDNARTKPFVEAKHDDYAPNDKDDGRKEDKSKKDKVEKIKRITQRMPPSKISKNSIFSSI